VYEWVGLVYEEDRRLYVTDLGTATYRWLGRLSHVNSPVLGRHAAYALAACQLRNPVGSGTRYASDVEVFPFVFIWKAMLELGNRISSDELNRVIFRVTNPDELTQAIEVVRKTRALGAHAQLPYDETIVGSKKNDRIISWVSLASFGWILIKDKSETGGLWYELRPTAVALVREAAQTRRRHRTFATARQYAEHISDAACLPVDLR
jgi:hypothetical protein